MYLRVTLNKIVYLLDPRFPPDGAVELHFCAGAEGRSSVPAPTPAVPVTSGDDPVTRVDSPFQLEDIEIDENDSDPGIYELSYSHVLSVTDAFIKIA